MQGSWKEAAGQATLGIEIVLGVVLPSWVGSLLDAHFTTRPAFILIGFLIGLAHGVRAVVRVVKEGDQKARAAELEMKRKRAEYHGRHPK